jgi:N-acetylglucosamine-6-phosphate deacetylase
MTTLRVRARHFRTGRELDWECAAAGCRPLPSSDESRLDVKADLVAPAFFDPQINGAGGFGFTRPDVTLDTVDAIRRTCHQHGMSEFFPTVITAPDAVIRHALRVICDYRSRHATHALAIPGIHLEGPFISPEDGPRGAHPRDAVRPPDWDAFRAWQDAAGGLIRLVTLAPEWPNALSMIERLRREGVRVALGHTDASPQRLRDAIAAGATLGTHLGNGCALYLHRHHNVIWEQLDAAEHAVSVIPDGFHLPWSVLRCILRLKLPDRVFITCDASDLAGLPPGAYQAWGQSVVVHPEGRITLAGSELLAGSWVLTDHCVSNLVEHAGLSAEEAIKLATEAPRRHLEMALPGDDELASAVLLKHTSTGGLALAGSFIHGVWYPPPSDPRLGGAAG